MRAWRLIVGTTSFALAAVLVAGCDDPSAPAGGVLRLAIATSGVDFDTDGYTVVVAGVPRNVPIHGAVVLTGLPVGDHLVYLEGVDPNCVVGRNAHLVRVTRFRLARVSFEVTCALRTGRIRARTTTVGAELDPDGYVLSIDGGTERPIGVNETITIDAVPGGSRGVNLTGVAKNCQVADGNSRSVLVPFGGGIVDVVFAIQCAATGRLQVTTVSSGIDLDPNGYTASVRRAELEEMADVATNGTVTIPTLVPGDYQVVLRGVAGNCEVTGANPRTVTIAAEAVTALRFDVVCAAVMRLAVVRRTDDNADIWTVNSNGTGATRLTTHAADDVEPAWSPDGSKIAFRSNRDGNDEIYVMNADGSGLVRLTQHTAADLRPTWSADGRRIAFESDRDGDSEIYVMNADGSGVTRLTDNDKRDSHPAWSPDGLKIAFESDRNGNADIYVMNADGSGVTELTTHPRDDVQPAWSPDGSKVAFARSVSCGYYGCDYDIYFVGVGGSAVTQVTSGPEDHREPAWSPDGRKIAFTFTICDYYCYNVVSSSVMVVKTDGTNFGDVTNGSASSPSWRR